MELDPNELNWHKRLAAETFNSVWDLMEKPDRSDYETLRMIHTAHASVVHWSYVGEAIHMARGEWQVSRVYTLAGMPESALYHGKRSLEICLHNNIGDFDLAFGYEAVARALKLGGRTEESEEYLQSARKAAQDIAEEGDRAYFLSQLSDL